jgi:hypothetical protein
MSVPSSQDDFATMFFDLVAVVGPDWVTLYMQGTGSLRHPALTFGPNKVSASTIADNSLLYTHTNYAKSSVQYPPPNPNRFFATRGNSYILSTIFQ